MLSMAGSSGMPPSSQFLPVRSIRCLKKLPPFLPLVDCVVFLDELIELYTSHLNI